MESKPFVVGDPLEALKTYGSGPHLLAAVQRGDIDIVTATLAQHLHKRLASDAQQAPTRTVAEQLFDPSTPQMPMPQQGMQVPQQAGLGALAPGAMPEAPMAVPPMPEAAPASEEAPMGMAEGGIAQLPVPDAMFDEPDNGGYGGGGLVAFAEGGASRGPMGPWFEAEVLRLFPGARITGRARTPERNRQVGGVSNSYHLTNDALDVNPPPGMSFTEFGNALRQHFGPGIDTIFNTKGHYDHVHLEPGGKGPPKGWERMPAEGGAAGLGALASGAPSIPSYAKVRADAERKATAEADRLFPGRGETINRIRDIANRGMSEESQREGAKQDKLEYLQAFFANLAGTTSPHFMQAVGSAAAAALPGRAAARKARRAEYMDHLKLLADAEGMSLDDAKAKVEYIRNSVKDATEATDKQVSLGVDVWGKQLQASTQLQQQAMQGQTSRDVAQMDADATRFAANTRAADYSGNEAVIAALASPDPNIRAAAEKFIAAKGPSGFDPERELGVKPGGAGAGGTGGFRVLGPE